MKLRTALIISLFICLLVIGSVSAADNGTDDVVSSELNKDSISHADKDVIDKQLDTLKESGISEKINENEKDVIEEKSTENSIKSLKNNDNTLGNTENTWTDIHYPDVFEVQLSSTEITLGESLKYTISHNDGAYEGNYIYIFIDDALYKKTSLHGTTCKSIDAIYGLNSGQHKIEFKREYGVFDMSKWDIINPQTSYSPSFYITVKSPQSPTISTTTSTTSSSKSKNVKTKSVYVTSKTVYYHTYNYHITLGWKGNFKGYFKVYKGKKQVYRHSLNGYNQKYYYWTNKLKVGKYTAKLIQNGKTLAKGKIIVKKAISKISVKSFKTNTGTKFRCYAYVWNKKDNYYLNGGYVKFKIKGKTYKAKVKNGVAIAKFKATKNSGKYICKAQYVGGKNIKSSKTKFKMVVKAKKVLKSTTIKIYKHMQLKKLHKNDCLLFVYQTYNAQYPPGLSVEGASYGGQNLAEHTKLIKAKAWYKGNGKTIKRVAKSKDGGYTIHFKLNGYKPYKVKVYYKNK